MSSIINSSEVDKEEIKSSKEPYFNFNHIRIKKLGLNFYFKQNLVY